MPHPHNMKTEEYLWLQSWQNTILVSGNSSIYCKKHNVCDICKKCSPCVKIKTHLTHTRQEYMLDMGNLFVLCVTFVISCYSYSPHVQYVWSCGRNHGTTCFSPLFPHGHVFAHILFASNSNFPCQLFPTKVA